MSVSNDTQSLGEQQTPQARARRRCLAGGLPGGWGACRQAVSACRRTRSQVAAGGLEPGTVREAMFDTWLTIRRWSGTTPASCARHQSVQCGGDVEHDSTSCLPPLIPFASCRTEPEEADPACPDRQSL
jgi:hypothetical protein